MSTRDVLRLQVWHEQSKQWVDSDRHDLQMDRQAAIDRAYEVNRPGSCGGTPVRVVTKAGQVVFQLGGWGSVPDEPEAPALWQDGEGNWWATSHRAPGDSVGVALHVMLTGDRPGRWCAYAEIVNLFGPPGQVVTPNLALGNRHGSLADPHQFYGAGTVCAINGCEVTTTDSPEGDVAVWVGMDPDDSNGPAARPDTAGANTWWDAVMDCSGSFVHVNTRHRRHTGLLTRVAAGHVELTVHPDSRELREVQRNPFATEAERKLVAAGRRMLIPRDDITTVEAINEGTT